MEKLEYLKKTFSRTNKKDYENYILTGIWHRIGNMDLKPVTQQYIKRADGKYALIDMYFPQINFAIEVDEPQHSRFVDDDNLRMDMVFRALTDDNWISCDLEASNDLFHRITVEGKTLKQIDKDIEEVVSKINTRIQEEKGKGDDWKWLSTKQELEQFKKNNNFLHVNDNISFRLIKDITNTIFGKNYISLQRGFLKSIDPEKKIHLWTPKLAVRKGDKLISPSKGWLNELSDDWKTIKEANDGKDLKTMNLEEERDNGWSRAVFAKYRNNLGISSYRFVGIFDFNKFMDKGKTAMYKRQEKEGVAEGVEIIK